MNKLEKIPFVPKVGQNYYTYTNYGGNNPYISKYVWNNSGRNKQRKAFGIVFRTEQEAKDYLPIWRKRLKGEEV